jgi:hypothetical protein
MVWILPVYRPLVNLDLRTLCCRVAVKLSIGVLRSPVAHLEFWTYTYLGPELSEFRPISGGSTNLTCCV